MILKILVKVLLKIHKRTFHNIIYKINIVNLDKKRKHLKQLKRVIFNDILEMIYLIKNYK